MTMEGLLRDIRYAVRSLRKRPAFSFLVVLVLAVAIAANSSIFGIVNAVILKPLAFKQPDQLVWIWAQRKTVSRAFFSIPNFIDTREQNQTLAEVAPFAIWPANLTGQGEAERLQGVRVSANAMQMLGVEAAAGRTLAPDDDNPNNTRVVMLTESDLRADTVRAKRAGADAFVPKMHIAACLLQPVRLLGRFQLKRGVLRVQLQVGPHLAHQLACPLGHEPPSASP